MSVTQDNDLGSVTVYIRQTSVHTNDVGRTRSSLSGFFFVSGNANALSLAIAEIARACTEGALNILYSRLFAQYFDVIFTVLSILHIVTSETVRIYLLSSTLTLVYFLCIHHTNHLPKNYTRYLVVAA